MLLWIANLDYAGGGDGVLTIARKYFVQITHNMARVSRRRR